MPRRALVRSAQVAAQTNQTAPRVRRFVDLRNQLKKLNEKDAQIFAENGVLYVHRFKKRPHLSRAEREEV